MPVRTIPTPIRPRRRDVLALAALPLVAGRVAAQADWPTRPLRMIVPSAAGSGGDIVCRAFCDWLGQSLKQAVVVDNKPGANGVLAADLLVRAPADGYTFAWLSASSTVIMQALQPKLDFTTDVVPVVQVGAGGIHLVCTPDVPARDLKELVAMLKAAPGRYDYATWGIGSTGHLMMEWLKNQAGVDVRHVPYKSMPQIYQDMQGGLVKLAWVDASSSVALIKAGRLRAIATSASKRGPAAPEVPTLTEQGYPFSTDAWYGVFAPRGTPPAIVTAINRHLREGLTAPSMQDRMIALNMGDAPQRSPEDFGRLVKSDLAVWQDIVRRNNIKVE